jgi:hypothetical protein
LTTAREIIEMLFQQFFGSMSGRRTAVTRGPMRNGGRPLTRDPAQVPNPASAPYGITYEVDLGTAKHLTEIATTWMEVHGASVVLPESVTVSYRTSDGSWHELPPARQASVPQEVWRGLIDRVRVEFEARQEPTLPSSG